MFLGNLSTANEHNARKKSGKKKPKDTSESESAETSGGVTRRLRVQAKPILYKNDSEPVPRDVLYEFLTTCSKMLLAKDNILEIIEDSIQRRIGLQVSAIEFQRDVLENNFQIERNYGCQHLSQMQLNYENDVELLEAGKNFMYCAMRSYLDGLKLRKEIHYKQVIKVPLNRVQILEFFEGCNSLMTMKETKEELRAKFQSTGQPPNALMIEMQHSILKLLGYEPSFAVSCLNKIGTDFANDKEILMKMQHFAMCAQVACRESMMSESQRKEFYAQVPTMMHHFPYLYFMQQERLRQQAMMNQNAGMDEATKQARLQEIEALKQSGLFALMSSEEGRGKMQQLAMRVQTSKQRLDEEVDGWSEEKRMEYFKGFADHPLLKVLEQCGTDPLAKINTFATMTESELDDMTRLLLVVGKDDGGSLLKELREKGGMAGPGGGLNSVMNGIFTTMGSLSNLKRPPAGAMPMSMGPGMHQMHNHDHAHGAGDCPYHRGGSMAGGPDVATGKADVMDR